eukprot:GHVT01062612.1.p1 GENE.GHVT01062612.1~~GHVT01062612.1.p1  ORF type:complete len:205 (+),score=52.20 GHVT01062612.1:78-617(+)
MVGDPSAAQAGSGDAAAAAATGRIISADEFWKQHAEELLTAKAFTPGSDPLAGFLARPPTFQSLEGHSWHGGEGTPRGATTVVNCSKAMLKNLVDEDPNTRQLYKTIVDSGKMAEGTFWEKFFKTRYFHAMVGRSGGNEEGAGYGEVGGIALNKYQPALVGAINERFEKHASGRAGTAR